MIPDRTEAAGLTCGFGFPRAGARLRENRRHFCLQPAKRRKTEHCLRHLPVWATEVSIGFTKDRIGRHSSPAIPLILFGIV